MLVRGDGVEFVADAVDVAAEPLDRLDAQVNRRLDARPRQGGDGHVRQPQQVGERGSGTNSPVGSATRSKKCLACSLRSPGSTSATHESGGR